MRNSDVEYQFRQNSDFLYLTGFNESEAVLVLIPGREHGEAVLFCRERDHEYERWHGKVVRWLMPSQDNNTNQIKFRS